MQVLSKSSLKQQDYMANVFSALADPTRLKLIQLLVKNDDKCVSELATYLGVSVSAVSQNCKILELNGIVDRQRMGQKICYRLRASNPFARKLIKLVTTKGRA